MSPTTADLRRCLRFLLHWGLVEIRNLGYAGGSHAQIADLADILEFLPEYLDGEREPDFDLIREQFAGYARRYPDSTYEYLAYLDGKPFHGRY
ncbi:MAG: hypothetical protein K2X82_34010 [Gemmataceae bacterium]|nr:hypothetical protein [Gemmataceae bacterium]